MADKGRANGGRQVGAVWRYLAQMGRRMRRGGGWLGVVWRTGRAESTESSSSSSAALGGGLSQRRRWHELEQSRGDEGGGASDSSPSTHEAILAVAEAVRRRGARRDHMQGWPRPAKSGRSRAGGSKDGRWVKAATERALLSRYACRQPTAVAAAWAPLPEGFEKVETRR